MKYSIKQVIEQIKEVQTASKQRKNLELYWPALTKQNLKELVIYGASTEGVRLFNICNNLGIKVVLIADDSSTKIDCVIGPYQVLSSENLSSLDRKIPIIIATHRALLPTKKCKAMGFKTVAPFMALQVMRPDEFIPHMFHKNLLEDLFSNLDEYELLADSLADNYSREVLAGVLKYRLTCDPLCLEDIIEWDLYGPNDLVNYSNDETYIDAGAFDGDSIKLFIDRVNGKYHKIIGFEPDPATYQDLKNNLNNHTDIDLINAGLYDSNQILKFNDAGTRGSIISEDGNIEIKVTSIDNVLNGEKVSYIKLNIEGSELKALDGAKRSIGEWEPKLAISAYHEADHLWKISKKINELSANYKLYLRQHDGGIIETVTFGIPR